MTPLSTRKTSAPARESLPGLPRTALTPQQQLEALARVQNQAEQRVRLGLQLFKAAEAHTTNHRQMLDEITAEREKFRDELSQDVTRSLHAFDQWIGQMDDTFTQAFTNLEERIDAVEQKLSDNQRHIQNMVDHAQKMLDQAMALLDGQKIAPVLDPAVERVDVAGADVRDAHETPAVKVSDTKANGLNANMQSFIKPVPPINWDASADDAQEQVAAVDETADEIKNEIVTPQGPIVQNVSYADILDRIYESRKQLNQGQ